MIRTKSLTLALLLVLSGPATPAESTNTVLSRLTNRSFSIDIPEGWEKQKLSSFHQGSAPLFDLVPIGSGRPEEDPTVRFYIRVAYYQKRLTVTGPDTAGRRWKAMGPAMSELPGIFGLPDWKFFGLGQELAAFASVGSDVLLFDLQAPDEKYYAQGKEVLVGILKSYRETRAGEPAP